MDKKFLPILIVVAGFILLSILYSGGSSCSDGVQNQGETGVDCGGPCSACTPSTTTTTLPDCTILTGEAKGECLYNQFVAAGEAAACAGIESDMWRQNCVYKIAVDARNTDLCSAFTDLFNVESCLKEIAVNSKDPEVCGLIDTVDQRDTCYYRLGIETSNQSSCILISGESSKYRCIALVERNYTFCNSITADKARDYCLLKVLERDTQKQVCVDVEDNNVAADCYLRLAVLKIDKDYCGYAGDKKQECYADVDEAQEKLDKLNEKLLDANNQARIVPK